MTRFRNCCFTINNPTDADIVSLVNPYVSYCIYGKEVGENGTPHLQGYLELNKQLNLNALKVILPRAHIEKRRGSQDQAIEYCKKDGDFVETGTKKKQGKRNDLAEIRRIVFEDHGNMLDIIHIASNYQSLKSAELLMKYRPPKNKYLPKKVFWFFGSTGKGKTKMAMDCCPENNTWISSEKLNWFDGYWGQTHVLIDDYRRDFTTFHFLLRLLDVYPLKVPIKGGYVDWEPDYIYITCPQSPTTLYNNRTDEDIAQLTRRITEVFDFDNDEIEIIEQ